jgi:hypothetical protein
MFVNIFLSFPVTGRTGTIVPVMRPEKLFREKTDFFLSGFLGGKKNY